MVTARTEATNKQKRQGCCITTHTHTEEVVIIDLLATGPLTFKFIPPQICWNCSKWSHDSNVV